MRQIAKVAARRRDSRWLSTEAVAAKRTRRRLERRWKSGRNEVDRIAYRRACRAANKAVTAARRHHYRQRVVEDATADPRRRWSAIRDLLHAAAPSETISTSECRQRCDLFANHFVQKIRNVKASIADKLARIGTVGRDPLDRDYPHVRHSLDDVEAPTIDDVTKIISAMPGKSSNVDVIPTSLLKSCADVFAPPIARLACLSFSEGRFPTRYKRQVLSYFNKESWFRFQQPDELPNHLQFVKDL